MARGAGDNAIRNSAIGGNFETKFGRADHIFADPARFVIAIVDPACRIVARASSFRRKFRDRLGGSLGLKHGAGWQR